MINAIINTTARAYLRTAQTHTVADHTALHLRTQTARTAQCVRPRSAHLSANWHMNPVTGTKTCVWSADTDSDTDSLNLSMTVPLQTFSVQQRFLRAA